MKLQERKKRGGKGNSQMYDDLQRVTASGRKE